MSIASQSGTARANQMAEKLATQAVMEDQLPPLSQKGIVEGKSFLVVVSELMGPEKFWFQIYGDKHYGALQSLMKDLDNFYKSDIGDNYTVKVKNITEVKVGTVLAAKFQDVYHRVVLRSVLPHNMKVKLEFIDYGTKDIQSVERCRYLLPRFSKLPAQAIEARLSGLASVKGAKTEDGKDVRTKMWQLLDSNICPPGSIMAVVQSGVNIPEFVTVQGQGGLDMSSKRGLALDLFDALMGGEGTNIGKMLLDLGLVKEEDRQEKYDLGGNLYSVVRKETAKCVSSVALQFLRQHETYLATRLEQFQLRARTEENSEDSVRFSKIKQRIEDFQSKLELIKERREKTEEEEIV